MVILPYTALYPFLLIAVRVLYLAANNPGNFDLSDLLLVLGTTLSGAIIVYLLAGLALRRIGSRDVPALVTFIAVAWFFGGPAIESSLPEGLRRTPLLVVLLGVLLSGLLIYCAARRPQTLRVGATFLSHTYVMLVAWLAVDIAMDRQAGRRYLTRSALVRELGRPIPAKPMADGLLRDIYVIVLDEYANSAVLRAVVGFDNSAFEDSLRSLGFHVPRAVQSNYTQTSLSLAALLNATHVYRLKDELARGSNDATVANHLVEQPRAARYAQGRGYRFVFFPSSWWYSTRWSPIADSVVEVASGFSLGRELSRSEFRRVLWHGSMISWFHREERGDDEIVRATFEGLGRLAADRRPIFALAHVLSPHVPYVFDSACGTRPLLWKRHPAAYTAQLQCVNRMLLATVTDLLRNSEIPPVIVLQGDHGTAFLEYSKAATALQVDAAAAGERFGAFGAYYLPDGGAADFGDTVSVVNVLGHVLRRYLDADLPIEADDLYLSVDHSPFDVHQVGPRWPRVEGHR